MKTKLLIVALLISITSFSQVNFGMTGGLTNFVPLATISVGYKFQPEESKLSYDLQYDMRSYASRSVNYPAYFGIRGMVSYPLNHISSVSFASGPYYKLASTDRKYLNGWKYGYGFKYTRKIFTAELYKIDKKLQISAGFYYCFEK